MDDQTKADLEDQAVDILRNASRGKGDQPGYLTAYQIFKRLPVDLRAALIQEYGEPGRGSTSQYSAASRVATAARLLMNAGKVRTSYLDTRGLDFDIGASDDAEAGFQLCGLYQYIQ